MMLWLIQFLVLLAVGYAALGFLFALWFVMRGVARVDETAREASWGLRLLLLPGSAAFWPLLIRRIVRTQ